MPIIEINHQPSLSEFKVPASVIFAADSLTEADAAFWQGISQAVGEADITPVVLPLGYEKFNCEVGASYPKKAGDSSIVEQSAIDYCMKRIGEKHVLDALYRERGEIVGKPDTSPTDQNGQITERGLIKKSEEGWIAILAALGLGSIIASFLSTRKRAGQSDS